MRARIPLLGVKICPVCGNQAVYDLSETEIPLNWIRLKAFGVDEIVCSQSCITQIYKHQTELQKQLETNRVTLPEDVKI